MRPFCPPEETLFESWGHVRRGYSRAAIEALVGAPAQRTAEFINPVTVICHDIGFANLGRRVKQMLWALLAPFTAAGYALHSSIRRGTETAYAWIKPATPVERTSGNLNLAARNL